MDLTELGNFIGKNGFLFTLGLLGISARILHKHNRMYQTLLRAGKHGSYNIYKMDNQHVIRVNNHTMVSNTNARTYIDALKHTCDVDTKYIGCQELEPVYIRRGNEIPGLLLSEYNVNYASYLDLAPLNYYDIYARKFPNLHIAETDHRIKYLCNNEERLCTHIANKRYAWQINVSGFTTGTMLGYSIIYHFTHY